MDGAKPDTALSLDPVSIGRLMPMFLHVSPTGQIDGAGPTLAKVWPGETLIGKRFLEVFSLRRPRLVGSMQDLLRHSGVRLALNLREAPHTAFKAICVPLDGGGVILNLSFGIHVATAVRDHGLTDRDFAPTDLAIEMLYLVEAKTAVMEELRKLNQRLQGARHRAEEQALTDALTGLRNRRAMDRALAQVIAARMPFGLMNIDLDYFKQVNDTLGHAAGDIVLHRVAQVLRAETREHDTVARVGGDEFVLIFPDLTDGTRLEAIGQRILMLLQEPVSFEETECRISASIGTTTSANYAAPNAEQMLSDADAALYSSKRDGRSRVTAFVPTGR